MADFEGKVGLVTGGVSEIGRALDVAFNNAGMDGDVGQLAEQTETNYQADFRKPV